MTAGRPNACARIAVWLVGPPRSAASATTPSRAKATVSDGPIDCATTTMGRPAAGRPSPARARAAAPGGAARRAGPPPGRGDSGPRCSRSGEVGVDRRVNRERRRRAFRPHPMLDLGDERGIVHEQRLRVEDRRVAFAERRLQAGLQARSSSRALAAPPRSAELALVGVSPGAACAEARGAASWCHGARGRRDAGETPTPRNTGPLRVLAEARADELGAATRPRPRRRLESSGELRPFRRRRASEPEDRLAVDARAPPATPSPATRTRWPRGRIRRRPRMQPEAIDDRDFELVHRPGASPGPVALLQDSRRPWIASRPAARSAARSSSKPSTACKVGELDQHREIDSRDDVDSPRLEQGTRRLDGVPPNMSVRIRARALDGDLAIPSSMRPPRVDDVVVPVEGDRRHLGHVPDDAAGRFSISSANRPWVTTRSPGRASFMMRVTPSRDRDA
jgi:hypothetical protein